MRIGIIIEIFKNFGQVPLLNDLLNMLERGMDNDFLIDWRSELGILFGPQLLVVSNFDITSSISEGVVGLIKKVSGLGFFK